MLIRALLLFIRIYISELLKKWILDTDLYHKCINIHSLVIIFRERNKSLFSGIKFHFFNFVHRNRNLYRYINIHKLIIMKIFLQIFCISYISKSFNVSGDFKSRVLRIAKNIKEIKAIRKEVDY